MEYSTSSAYSEQALLIECDPFMQSAVADFLHQIGYAVTPAMTVQEGVAALALNGSTYHLLVLDPVVPEFDGDKNSYFTLPGLRLAHEVKKLSSPTGVVIWSAYTTRVFPKIWELIGSGHSGVAYLPKGCPKVEFQEAIAKATSGDIFISRNNPATGHFAVDELFIQALPAEIVRAVEQVAGRLAQLAPQELTIAQRISKENWVIAAELGISTRTVAHYMDSIYTKLGFKDPRAGLQPYRRQSLIALAAVVAYLRS